VAHNKVDITRRDFINGIALSVAAGSSLSPLELLAKQGTPYPPALTGLRGNHKGSFEAAHARAMEGKTWPRPGTLTDDVYDLVVVGGGISGLSAAFLFQQQAGFDKRVLVLDNHDDFGGHATRNEFTVDGRLLIGYGGSQSIDSPSTYSTEAAALLRDVGIHVKKFYDYFDGGFRSRHQLRSGIYFSRERYGRDSVHVNALRPFESGLAENWRDLIDEYPLSDEARSSLVELVESPRDYHPGMSHDEKITLMRRISYSDYLRKYAKTHEDIVALLRDLVKGLWGFGFDALSALEGARFRMPGTRHMNWEDIPRPSNYNDEPYIFHFPDGNAGIARALVRQLIPPALPGSTMEDLVTTPVDYDQLDRRANRTRIRLNSTAIDVRHATGEKAVDVTYVCESNVRRVRGKHVILACYNNVVPHICPELPREQVEAINLPEKIPLVYISIALRNWKAFADLGYGNFYIPQADFMHSFGLDFPVNVGDYTFAQSPSDPIMVHGTFAPTVPDQGYSEREQHVRGRKRMLRMSFDDFESQIVRQMSGALGGGGFDAERDIAAITVNRWPHGYAYEYNELFDPPEWNRYNGPHQVGAAQIGRISMANSDASAYAYVNGAIDAAVRAVREQT